MGINKNFVVRHGFEASTDLILANADTRKVGIGTTNPKYTLDVRGGIGATDFYLTGIGTFANELNVGSNGSVLTVLGAGNSVGVGTALPEYLLDIRSPVSTGQTALYVQGDVRISGDLNVDDIIINYLNVIGFGTLANLYVPNTGTATIGVGIITSLSGSNIGYNIGSITNFNTTNLSVGIATIGNLTLSGAASTDFFVTRNLRVGGISTLAQLGVSGVTTTQFLGVTGVSTFTGNLTANSNVSIASSLNVTGIITGGSYRVGTTEVISSARQLQNIASLDSTTTATIEAAIANATNTFSDLRVSGLSTFVGLATFNSGLQVVSGITTLGSTNTTQLNVSGIGTITTLNSTSGTITNLTGTAGTITDLNSTSANLTNISGTNLNYSGIGTINTFVVGTQAGKATISYTTNTARILTIPSLGGNRTFAFVNQDQTFIGTQAFNNLNVTGVSAFGNVRISSGIVTATSGIVTYYGDGSFLQNVISGVGINTASGVVGTGATILDFRGSGISTVTVSAGIATINIESGSGGTPGGTNGQVQFNSSGTFAGSSNFTFDGNNVNVTGIVTAIDFNSTSDKNLKYNVETVENALDIMSSLRGVSFNWKENDRKSYGVIAQELEEVLPELVSTGEIKTVNYNGIIGVLIEAIKELKAEIEELKSHK